MQHVHTSVQHKDMVHSVDALIPVFIVPIIVIRLGVEFPQQSLTVSLTAHHHLAGRD